MGWIMGGGLLLLVAALVVVRGGAMFITVLHVPDGEDWQQFYKARKEAKRTRRPGRATWWLIGAGVGVAAVAGLLAWAPWAVR